MAFPPVIRADWANHYLYGSVIFTVALYILAILVALPVIPAILYSLAAVAVFAILKEIADAYRNWRATGDPMVGPHGVEVLDSVWTFVGGLNVAIACAVVLHAFKLLF
jgi:hypothetical protein